MRYPAYPLIVHDPFFSIWSFADKVNEDYPRHWTGHNFDLMGLLRIDGKPYTFLSRPRFYTEKLPQTSLEVTATRTVIQFQEQDLSLKLTFTTPLLPDRLDVLARPVTYIQLELQNTGKKKRSIDLYFDSNAAPAAAQNAQSVSWGRLETSRLDILTMGTVAQNILGSFGDDHLIDWGRACLVVPKSEGFMTGYHMAKEGRTMFVKTGLTLDSDCSDMPAPASTIAAYARASFVLNSGETASRTLMFAYDDIYSIEYLHTRLRPWWYHSIPSFSDMLDVAYDELPELLKECEKFDKRIAADASKAGGKAYVAVCNILYRQAIAAHKLVESPNGHPWFFSKENFSNGCIATMDVTYPSTPLFFQYNPTLVKGMLEPVLDYARTSRWKFPFAPHDLGTYPLANGQVYGGGEKTEENQMPVEESGNVIILADAMLHYANDLEFVKKYCPLFDQWAEYLVQYGEDPEEQLCTDDFAGHLAHNANLAVKAIVALAAYADICKALGKKAEAAKYRKIAEKYAKAWPKKAAGNGHTVLAYGQPDSWSLKYNLIWDRLLKLDLFPASVFQAEADFYKTKLNKYGIPLDSRSDYTKLDWIYWAASLTGNRKDFDAITKPILAWLQESPTRVPVTDWYWTTSGEKRGFQARSVVGGCFIAMLPEK